MHLILICFLNLNLWQIASDPSLAWLSKNKIKNQEQDQELGYST